MGIVFLDDGLFVFCVGYFLSVGFVLYVRWIFL